MRLTVSGHVPADRPVVDLLALLGAGVELGAVGTAAVVAVDPLPVDLAGAGHRHRHGAGGVRGGRGEGDEAGAEHRGGHEDDEQASDRGHREPPG